MEVPIVTRIAKIQGAILETIKANEELFAGVAGHEQILVCMHAVVGLARTIKVDPLFILPIMLITIAKTASASREALERALAGQHALEQSRKTGVVS